MYHNASKIPSFLMQQASGRSSFYHLSSVYLHLQLRVQKVNNLQSVFLILHFSFHSSLFGYFDLLYIIVLWTAYQKLSSIFLFVL